MQAQDIISAGQNPFQRMKLLRKANSKFVRRNFLSEIYRMQICAELAVWQESNKTGPEEG